MRNKNFDTMIEIKIIKREYYIVLYANNFKNLFDKD